MKPPEYFSAVRQETEERWEKLDADAGLAGPWRQLFRQVQSPRHVVSELLQNADDAGATRAEVRVEDGVFVFEHDGRDFTEADFRSLCGFGTSNKRTLHTIGFRGIGFKSAFSLGHSVHLQTPSLAVTFSRSRFTLPQWAHGPHELGDRLTRVRVPISDGSRREALESNLLEWSRSPFALLFLRNVRELELPTGGFRWDHADVGPVDGSEWMIHSGAPETRFLVVRSELQSFPADAVQEIRDERPLGDVDEGELPPCRVELVLNQTGRLFVVLPTGVHPNLPFSCNAPFVQDPARMKIKEPALSPTNQWLLARIGRLAAVTMLDWLGKDTLPISMRAMAYDLMPDVDREDVSLEGDCARVIEESFEEVITGRDSLLTSTGNLRPCDPHEPSVITVPRPLMNVWPQYDVGELLDDTQRPALAGQVSDENRVKLENWNWTEEADWEDTLERTCLPRPDWPELAALWSFVEPSLYTRRPFYIAPVIASDQLQNPKRVVRLSGRRAESKAPVWQYLRDHVAVIDPDWLRFLREASSMTEETVEANALRGHAQDANSVLKELGFGDPSDTQTLFTRAEARILDASPTADDLIRVTHAAAALDVAVSEDFPYFTRGGELMYVGHESYDEMVLDDRDGSITDLFGADWVDARALHDDYYQLSPGLCDQEQWLAWLSDSGKSRVLTFPIPESVPRDVMNRRELEELMRSRGADESPHYHYKYSNFRIHDFDMPRDRYAEWAARAEQDEQLWVRLTLALLSEWKLLGDRIEATARHIATTGNTRVSGRFRAAWLHKLRSLPCLPDTNGFPARPSELLRRSAQTEPLIGLERFVHTDIDTEHLRTLLHLLGVRAEPAGPDTLIAQIRDLASMSDPPLDEVEQYVRRLDQMISDLDTEEVAEVRAAFHAEALVPVDGGGWARSNAVFGSPSAAVPPGLPVVHGPLRRLSLWGRVGVAEQPNEDLAIKWLSDLPLGGTVEDVDAGRLRAVLSIAPGRVWTELGAWLSLAGTWVETSKLRYWVGSDSPGAWSRLHVRARALTADYRMLDEPTIEKLVDERLTPLGSALEFRVSKIERAATTPLGTKWWEPLGHLLTRVVLQDDDEQTAVRRTAMRLSATEWQPVARLKVVPCLEGEPAGAARPANAAWIEHTLYVVDRTPAQVARAVASELGRWFERADISDALKICFDRPRSFIEGYVAENFDLDASIDAEAAGGVEPQEAGVEAQEPDTNDLPISRAGNERQTEVEHKVPPETELSPESPEANVSQRRQRTSKSRKIPPLMERFAHMEGFTPAPGLSGVFRRQDGSSLRRRQDGQFRWELADPDGSIRYLKDMDHCLHRDPLVLESDVWSLIADFPDEYSLVLVDPHGLPVEIRGTKLVAMLDKGTLTLHPGTYRLVIQTDR